MFDFLRRRRIYNWDDNYNLRNIPIANQQPSDMPFFICPNDYYCELWFLGFTRIVDATARANEPTGIGHYRGKDVISETWNYGGIKQSTWTDFIFQRSPRSGTIYKVRQVYFCAIDDQIKMIPGDRLEIIGVVVATHDEYRYFDMSIKVYEF